MTISRWFASRNFRIDPTMKNIDKIVLACRIVCVLLNAIWAPKSDGKLRWEQLIVHSPIVWNPNSLAFCSTELKRHLRVSNTKYFYTNNKTTYSTIAMYFRPKLMLFDFSDYKLGKLYVLRSVLEVNVPLKLELHQLDKLKETVERESAVATS